MRLLVDSHVALWWIERNDEMGPECRSKLEQASEVFFSAVTPGNWESRLRSDNCRCTIVIRSLACSSLRRSWTCRHWSPPTGYSAGMASSWSPLGASVGCVWECGGSSLSGEACCGYCGGGGQAWGSGVAVRLSHLIAQRPTSSRVAPSSSPERVHR